MSRWNNAVMHPAQLQEATNWWCRHADYSIVTCIMWRCMKLKIENKHSQALHIAYWNSARLYDEEFAHTLMWKSIETVIMVYETIKKRRWFESNELGCRSAQSHHATCMNTQYDTRRENDMRRLAYVHWSRMQRDIMHICIEIVCTNKSTHSINQCTLHSAWCNVHFA